MDSLNRRPFGVLQEAASPRGQSALLSSGTADLLKSLRAAKRVREDDVKPYTSFSTDAYQQQAAAVPPHRTAYVAPLLYQYVEYQDENFAPESKRPRYMPPYYIPQYVYTPGMFFTQPLAYPSQQYRYIYPEVPKYQSEQAVYHSQYPQYQDVVTTPRNAAADVECAAAPDTKRTPSASRSKPTSTSSRTYSSSSRYLNTSTSSIRSGVTKPAGRMTATSTRTGAATGKPPVAPRTGTSAPPRGGRPGAASASAATSSARSGSAGRSAPAVRGGKPGTSATGKPKDAKALMEEAYHEVYTLREQIKYHEQRSQHLTELVTLLSQERDIAQNALLEIGDAYDASRDQAQQVVRQREAQIAELQRSIDEKNKRILELESSIRELDIKCRSYEVEMITLKELNKRFESEGIEFKVKARSLETQLYREQRESAYYLSTMKADFEAELKSYKTTFEMQIHSIREQHSSAVQELKAGANEELKKMQTKYDSLRIDLEYSETQSMNRRDRIAQMEKYIAELTEKTYMLEDKRRKDEVLRKKLHNTIQELKGNIRVYCRVRPPLPKELGEDSANKDLAKAMPHIKYTEDDDDRGIEVAGDTFTSALGAERDKKYAFQFDKVFRPAATQEGIFEEISQLVYSALDGYKVCIFAYGYTGSGKTYTMEGKGLKLGASQERGMIPRSVEYIFATAKEMCEQGWEYTIEASFLEIYNETLRDLLVSDARIAAAAAANQPGGCSRMSQTSNGASSAASSLPTLEIKHDKTNTTVEGLTSVTVTKVEQVYELLRMAKKNRKVGATECNERSSRSHSVFTLKITGKNEATYYVCNGVLNLIDLAGSERLSQSKATGDRKTETQYINSSLSMLGDVIHALAQKKGHIPFRNSKLTYLLQNALGGDSKTLMFVNVSPLQVNANETIQSLRFASKVNSCEIGTAKRNVVYASV